MDQKSLPGTFILKAAETGLKTAATLSTFASSTKVKDLASKLSLSATLLSEIGKDVNQNADYFKANFHKTFENVLVKCEEQYETVLAGLETAADLKSRKAEKGTEDAPKKPWKLFLCGLNMDKDDFEEFEKSLEESWLRALMLQRIVSLVVLQIRAQKQELTPSELNNLTRLKKGMGTLLETIRDSEIASVVAFGLSDLTKAANAVQIIEAAAENCSADDTSSISTTSTVFNPSLDSLKSGKNKVVFPAVEPIYPPKPEDKYEIYRTSFTNNLKKRNETVFRLLKIPIKIDRSLREPELYLNKIPATTTEIRAFIATEKASKNTQPTTLNSLINISVNHSMAIYKLINSKNEERCYPHREWSAELLVPYGGDPKKNEGYIVVLRGEVSYRSFSPGPPPPPPGWRSGPPVITNVKRRQSAKIRKEKISAAQIQLTQIETETVINDFLATFSTMYDGVPVEERGAALRNIELDEVDDLDYDSDDSSSSCSTRSLVDD